MTDATNKQHHQVVIVGGGTAGIGLAAALHRREPTLNIAVIEPSDKHYYQPAFTLVGGGCYPIAKTERDESTLIPPGVTWVRSAAELFDAEGRAVLLADGGRVGYNYLVFCPGLQLDWDRVEGLPETLGRNGVASNYDPQTVPYTWECLRDFCGKRAVFTAEDRLSGGRLLAADGAPRGRGDRVRHRRRPAVFGGRLRDAAQGGGQAPRHQGELPQEPDRGRRRAPPGPLPHRRWRRRNARGGGKLRFPARDAAAERPDFIKRSPFADAAGWVEVDHATLQHRRYPEVFGLGDATCTPNSKTAAAARSQIPVVRDNLLARMRGETPSAEYDGYGACPLTTARGRVILAEFCYGGRVTPSFPLDPTQERRLMWHFKKDFMPWFYWNYLLKGRTWDVGH